MRPQKKDFFLVYEKTPFFRKTLKEHLSKIEQINFKFFPDRHQDFIKALASCRGIIAPAGHQLICEACYLKKPLLVIPEKGQHEQHLNARMLELSGRGK